MYPRPRFLETLHAIREEMSREADYDVELFAERARTSPAAKPPPTRRQTPKRHAESVVTTTATVGGGDDEEDDVAAAKRLITRNS